MQSCQSCLRRKIDLDIVYKFTGASTPESFFFTKFAVAMGDGGLAIVGNGTRKNLISGINFLLTTLIEKNGRTLASYRISVAQA